LPPPTSIIGDLRAPAQVARVSPRAVVRATFAAVFDGRPSAAALVEGLTLAIDRETLAHSCRVRANTVALAAAVGIADTALLAAMAAGALLHDIGKLAIPQILLQKPGPLDPREFERVKRHPVLGAQLLIEIRTPEVLVSIVRHHHENWDGSGYPDGLAGTAIPLGARVLGIIDCYDALTSHRPYRRALSRDRAVEMIERRSGTMYDPAIVRAFLSIQAALASDAEPLGITKEPAA
jgi:putative nucleotidyltransferase with HDIG domain